MRTIHVWVTYRSYSRSSCLLTLAVLSRRDSASGTNKLSVWKENNLDYESRNCPTVKMRLINAASAERRSNLITLLMQFQVCLTFPEDWMPFITAKQTINQAASSDRVILQFRPPLSAIVLVMFRVSRYQKYVVAELFSHSGSMTNRSKKNWVSVHLLILIYTVYMSV